MPFSIRGYGHGVGDGLPSSLLWVQPLLVIAVLAATVGAGRRLVRDLRWHPMTWVLALALPLMAALLLPGSEYHFAGHEGAYGQLLDGELPLDDLGSHRIFPVPSGIAWALGALPGSLPTRGLWLFANRASLFVLVLGLAASAGLLARRREQDEALAGLVAAVALFALIPALGWSATAFAIGPALACGAISLAFGLAGRPGPCLAWGALAFGTRMEVAVLLLAAALAAGPAAWAVSLKRPRPALLIGLLACAMEAVSLAAKRAELPLESTAPDAGVFLENLSCLWLGGAWFRPWVLLALIVLVVLRRRPPAALLIALGVALVQPLFLVDVGARHLLPAAALIITVGSGLVPGPSGLVFAFAWLALPLIEGSGDLRELSHRYAAGADAHLPAWVEAADAGRSGHIAELVDPDCYLVLPRGEESFPGAASTGDVREIHNAALEIAGGGCVQWATYQDAEFVGDTAAERLDRARFVLGLQPSGWAEGDGQRWMLWRAGHPANR